MVKFRKVLVTTGVVSLAVGIVGATAAFAGGPRIGATAELLGMERADLVAELQAGKTIAQVAEENGIDVQVIIGELVNMQSERLEAAVAEGKITQERADEILAGVEDKAAELVNTTWSVDGHGRGHFRRHMRFIANVGLVNTAAEVLGMERADLVAELRSGSALADVAEANGIAPEAIVDEVVAKAEERLATAVEKGRIPEDRVDDILERVEDKATDRLDDTWPEGRGLRDGHRMGPRGGFGPGFGRGGAGFGGGFGQTAPTAPDVTTDVAGTTL